MTKIGSFGLYRGLMIVADNGSVYRQVTEEDIRRADENHPVYEVRTLGLEYVPSVAHIAKPVPFMEPRIVDGRVHHGPTDNSEIMLMTPLSIFTGTADTCRSIPEVVYVVPVEVGISWPNSVRQG